jgi:hypothetical protein
LPPKELFRPPHVLLPPPLLLPCKDLFSDSIYGADTIYTKLKEIGLRGCGCQGCMRVNGGEALFDDLK